MNTMICKLIRAGHDTSKLLRYISGKSLGMTADFGFGRFRLPRNGIAWAIQALQSFHSNSRACQVRHVVFSTPKVMETKQAKASLARVCRDWIATYAPDRNWLFGFHNDNGILHGHLAVANLGPDSKPLKFRPHVVVTMSEMAFTKHAISAKGKGKIGLPIYTKTRKQLAVQDLAAALLDTNGEIQPKVWDDLESQGLITGCRTRKDESLISFLYGGKRIRLSTLQRYIDHEQSMKTPNHNPSPPSVAIKKTKQPADPLPSKLVHTGLSPTKVASINAALLSANLVSKPAKPKKSRKPKHPTPPTQ